MDEGTMDDDDLISEVGLAAKYGNLEELKHLISVGRPIDVDDYYGWRPLHEASVSSKGEYLKCMEELLKYDKTDVNCRTKKGETALYLACKHGDESHTLQAVQILLFVGADVNIPDYNDATPLLTATRLGRANIVQAILGSQLADPNLGNYGNWRPLHHAAKNNRTDLIQMLLTFGAQLNVESTPGMTPIDIAAAFGNIESLNLLLVAAKERCQLHLVTSPYRCMPFVAYECVELLLSYNANIDLERTLKTAIKQNDHEMLKVVLQGMRVGELEDNSNKHLCMLSDAHSKYGNPLHVAIEFQSYECLRVMLDGGFPVDSICMRDIMLICMQQQIPLDLPIYETGLSLSLRKRDIRGAKILLSAGANSNPVGAQIFPPLFSAILYGTPTEIDLVLEHGADLSSREVLIVALSRPENLFHILRRGADPSSCFTSNRSLFVEAILSLHDQEMILLVLQILLAFLDHVPRAMNLLINLAENCLEMFDTDYDDESWARLINSVHSPSSLVTLCRFSLRHHLLRLHGTALADRIDDLEIPQSCISFLSYKNTEWDSSLADYAIQSWQKPN